MGEGKDDIKELRGQKGGVIRVPGLDEVVGRRCED